MKKVSKKNIFGLLKKKWYIQAFNSTPLLLDPCGASQLDLKLTLGDSFKEFFCDYRKEFGKFYYSLEDLNRLAQIIIKKIQSDKRFLSKVYGIYERGLTEPRRFYKQIDKCQIKKTKNDELCFL